MIIVHVWMPTAGLWGHASIWLRPNGHHPETYISWNPMGVPTPLDGPASIQTYRTDIAMEENKRANYVYFFPIPQFSADAIYNLWIQERRTLVYNGLARNCCTMVHSLIHRAGGSYYCNWEPITWWGPRDIKRYCDDICNTTRLVRRRQLTPQERNDINSRDLM